MSLARIDPRDLAAVQLDYVDTVATVDAEGDRPVRAAQPE